MRRAAPLASLALLVTVASCANIAGLSSLDEVDHCVGSSCAMAAGGSSSLGGNGGGGVTGTGGSGGSVGGKGGSAGVGGKGGSGGAAGAAGGGGGSGGSAGAGAGGKGGGGAGGTGGTTGGAAGKGGAGGKGGSGGTAGNGGSGGVPCVPKTCEQLGATCGVIDDGCGHSVACGTPPSMGTGGAAGAGGGGGGVGGSGGGTVVGGACPDPLTCGGDPSFPKNCGCAPGQTRCQGDKLQRCSADGQVFIDMATCQPGMCSASGCAKCVIGQKECVGNQPGTCQDDGNGGTLFNPSGPACGADLCNDTNASCYSCVPGSLLCVGSVINKCVDGSATHKQIEACMSPGLCQASLHAGKCLEPVCNAGDRTCVTEGPTTTLRECNADRTGFDVKDTCATAALCDISKPMCTMPACPAGAQQCVGNDLQKCNKDQTGFDTAPCAAPTPTCDGSSNTCIDRGATMIAVGPDMTHPLFWMDATEVTGAEFAAFITSLGSGAPVPVQPAECGWNTVFQDGSPYPKDQTPMVNVDWCDAWSYCNWAGKHLCGKVGGGTEPAGSITDYATDELTRACEGDLQLLYMYGPTYMAGACNEHKSGPGTLVAVQSSVTCQAGGVYDLIGNAGEWEDACSGTSGMSDACPFRGGAFDTPMDGSLADCKTAVTVARSTKSPHIGFRCCAE